MAIPTDELNRMMVDIMAGRPAPKGEAPDRANMRRVLRQQIKDMEKRGVMVEIPPELPEA